MHQLGSRRNLAGGEMTAPIRSMAGLVDALRSAQVDRELSYDLLDALSGLQNGYTAKLLGPAQSKRLGPISTFPLLGALGKALALVDDPEQIEMVKGRWKQRKIVGGSARQIRLRTSQIERASIGSNLQKLADLMLEMSANERILMGASIGGKQRAKKLGKRKRQRIASHAAKQRWAKQQQQTT
jgi:glycerol-3-phosphate O-acyltransferase